jgi:hypothetical protein
MLTDLTASPDAAGLGGRVRPDSLIPASGASLSLSD